MNILLTGASSFTGFWFAGKLREAGHTVVAPLRGSAQTYSGVRADRVRWLSNWAEVVPDCAFGAPAFLDLVATRDFDVLCCHAAEVRDYRSPDFDVLGAVGANTLNLRRVLDLMSGRGLKALVATGSVFEPDEGAGGEPRRAFSAYGLSKAMTFQAYRYWGEAVGVPVSKFVIANPFGPFEEPRFVSHVVQSWAKGEAVEVRTPRYVRDNIHVDLLALAYARFVGEAATNGAARRLGPSGYMETQGAFAERLARELGGRLGLASRVALSDQTDFSEPLVRINTDPLDAVALGWDEAKAWDALAGYYRGRGVVAGQPEIVGAIDVFNQEEARGWLAAKPAGAPRYLKVMVNGVERASVRADIYRDDLRRLGVSDGRSGFRYDFAGLSAYEEAKVRLADRETGRPLPGGADLRLPPLVGAPDSPFLSERGAPVVSLAFADYSGAAPRFILEWLGPEGAFTPPLSDDASLRLAELRPVDHPYFRALGLSAVHAVVDASGGDPESTIAMRFGEADALAPQRRLVAPRGVPAAFARHGAENMARVSGPNEQIGRFAATGYATAYRLEAMVRAHFGRGLADCGPCLDWGAGAGRVALPLKHSVAPGLRLCAVDVDAYNIEFARTHLRDIDFALAPFTPPLPYDDASFGAVFGISVMTHLTEPMQFAWLEELRRIARPGAPVILTAHSEYALHRTSDHAPHVRAQTLKQGFSDWNFDGNLGDKLAQKNYYRATFHTHKYILKNWSTHFEVLRIYPNANGLLQDYIVMRAR